MLTITDYKTEVIRHMTEYKIPSISFQYGDASYTFPDDMDDDTSALMMNLFDDRAKLWKHWEKYHDVELDIDITFTLTNGELEETTSGIPYGY